MDCFLPSDVNTSRIASALVVIIASSCSRPSPAAQREKSEAQPAEQSESKPRFEVSDATRCAPDGALIDLPEVPEASGLAASVRTPGLFWTMNDTGEPMVFAIDSTGKVR